MEQKIISASSVQELLSIALATGLVTLSESGSSIPSRGVSWSIITGQNSALIGLDETLLSDESREQIWSALGESISNDTQPLRVFFGGTDADLVPAKVTMRQARLALLAAGQLATVNAIMATLPEEAKIIWEYSIDIHRDHPLTLQLGQALGLDSAGLDQLFKTAREL